MKICLLQAFQLFRKEWVVLLSKKWGYCSWPREFIWVCSRFLARTVTISGRESTHDRTGFYFWPRSRKINQFFSSRTRRERSVRKRRTCCPSCPTMTFLPLLIWHMSTSGEEEIRFGMDGNGSVVRISFHSSTQ